MLCCTVGVKWHFIFLLKHGFLLEDNTCFLCIPFSPVVPGYLADSYLITNGVPAVLWSWSWRLDTLIWEKSSQGTLEFNYIWKIAAITQQQMNRNECLITATDLRLGFSYKPVSPPPGRDSFIYLCILILAECAQQQVWVIVKRCTVNPSAFTLI